MDDRAEGSPKEKRRRPAGAEEGPKAREKDDGERRVCGSGTRSYDPELMKEFGFHEPDAGAPSSRRSSSTWGSARRSTNPRSSTRAVEELAAITGQKPVVTNARKSIANFKLREGQTIGAMVTLRGDRDVRVPRPPRDRRAAARARLQGRVAQGFDGRGNYTLGVREQIIFPEIDYDKVDKIKGMNITIVTTARTDEEGRRSCATSACRSVSKGDPRWPKLSKMAQAKRKLKFAVRQYNRCPLCGRPRAFLRKFEMCRLCFRKRALQGEIPGVIKSSW